MSERSKYANEPLMYIHQPTQGKPHAPMQHFYTTPKQPKTLAPTPEIKKKTIKTPVKKIPSLSSFAGEAPQDKPKYSSSAVQERKTPESSLSQEQKDQENKKKFKDMTIQEKITYFLNSSNHLPRMRCEVLTEERKYRGIILNLEDNEVQMRVGRRTVFIKKEDIQDIQLLGLGY
ncbi:CotO family spore coat protein [Paucisalibacillus sp. EB02]|uniref:CotO family spore coat protein n=1 Tax=Paucisalibacillus sp. EB02 TaxID=1347087 RepID=UPI0005AB1EFC|nr:CotO family spore coat protein [Paucisalibacillus sp. EB02]